MTTRSYIAGIGVLLVVVMAVSAYVWQRADIEAFDDLWGEQYEEDMYWFRKRYVSPPGYLAYQPHYSPRVSMPGGTVESAPAPYQWSYLAPFVASRGSKPS